jgi:histidine phosphotransferase ChpT
MDVSEIVKVTLDPLDLAALLCSRVCHDVISPVGAIVNGLEVLDDEKDGSMREFANDLIRKSAKQASARLQFARIAFGAAGSAGSSIDLGDAEQVARGFIQDDRVSLVWQAPREYLPKNIVKLLLNLLMVASHAIPRGGEMTMTLEKDEERVVIKIAAKGVSPRIPPHFEDLIAGRAGSNGVDAHAIQPYYAGLLAKAANMSVTFKLHDDMVMIEAR